MYCTNCGKMSHSGARYCSQCGHMISSTVNYSSIVSASSHNKETECPQCGGSGRVSTGESSNGVVSTVTTFGIVPLLNYILGDGKWECPRCKGKGVVS